eukprot:2110246-Ditylum_brightwellii.AAC.1
MRWLHAPHSPLKAPMKNVEEDVESVGESQHCLSHVPLDCNAGLAEAVCQSTATMDLIHLYTLFAKSTKTATDAIFNATKAENV